MHNRPLHTQATTRSDKRRRLLSPDQVNRMDNAPRATARKAVAMVLSQGMGTTDTELAQLLSNVLVVTEALGGLHPKTQ